MADYIKYDSGQDFKKTDKYFKDLKRVRNKTNSRLDDVMQECIAQLKSVTPTDTGLTADSWYYIVEKVKNNVSIQICNKNVNDGVNIALILQFGHLTSNNYWIEGIDYIDPVVRQAYYDILNKAWKEIEKL